MPWPCCAPHWSVRRISMSRVPWSSSRRSGSGVLAICVDGLRLIRRPSTASSRAVAGSQMPAGLFLRPATGYWLLACDGDSAPISHSLPEPFAFLGAHVMRSQRRRGRSPPSRKPPNRMRLSARMPTRLPERHLAQAEQQRHQPVPQQLHHVPANEHEDRDASRGSDVRSLASMQPFLLFMTFQAHSCFVKSS